MRCSSRNEPRLLDDNEALLTPSSQTSPSRASSSLAQELMGVQVSKEQLLDEAQSCKRQALAYVGKPEAPFLLKVAEALEHLAFRGSERR